MKFKSFIAAVICFILLFCTACGGKTQPPEKVPSAKKKPEHPEYFEEVYLTDTEQAIYYKFLTEQFDACVKDDGKGMRTPPQFDLAEQRYAFYDVDKDGNNDLLHLEGPGTDNEKRIQNIYSLRDGAVKEIPIRCELDGVAFHPVVLNDGTLRAEVGFGHIPGYAYLKLINGAYEIKDILTPPCSVETHNQKNYEFRHYEDEYYNGGHKKRNMKTQTVAAGDFDRLIAELNDGAELADLDITSLLVFGQKQKLSLKWLSEPVNDVVSVPTPKEDPIVYKNTDSIHSYEALLKTEQTAYLSKIKAAQAPDALFNAKEPARRYYAVYNVDGAGGEELFFGEQNKDGEILIKDVRYWTDEGMKKMPVGQFNPAWLEYTRLLGNGRVLESYVISEGKFLNRLKQYTTFGTTNILWFYGPYEDMEYVFYNYSNRDGSGRLPVALIHDSVYGEQESALYKGGENYGPIDLPWMPLESYGN
ncbi:MAG: hypothetical protein K5756_03355 [Clostridiales bacterium]|nr:hypothetical protein [Clostridiales bacterium]